MCISFRSGKDRGGVSVITNNVQPFREKGLESSRRGQSGGKDDWSSLSKSIRIEAFESSLSFCIEFPYAVPEKITKRGG